MTLATVAPETPVADMGVLAAHARSTPAGERAARAIQWAALLPRGAVLVSTCHRVELYGARADLVALPGADSDGTRLIDGLDAARHLVTLAVGRDSAVVGEDQVLHQLRVAINTARRRGGVARQLDRAFDVALHAGRRARSWLPANRPTLVDVALDRAVGQAPLAGAAVHVVGAGEMGQRALAQLLSRGARPTVSSRTIERARAAAERFGVEAVQLDPGPAFLGRQQGLLVAISGSWELSTESADALASSTSWLIDLSAPPALPERLVPVVRERLVSVDDLARVAGGAHSGGLLQRLDALVDETVAAFERWVADEARRQAAEALAERARVLKAAELDRLWRRLPALDEGERAEVTRAVEQLTERLLRDPLEQLGNDDDGSRARAARELFRL